jgi:hypothetical protein
MKRLALALAAAAFAAPALAQPLSPSGLTGNENWSCATGGPGGPSVFCTANLMRNTTGYQLTSTATGAITLPNTVVRTIFTSALSGGVTATTPAAPFDGEMLEVANGTGLAFTQTITLTAASGQTVNSGAVATLAAGGSAEWQYSASNTTWYRLR